MMEMFSFRSSAKEHQVFGTLKEAVKLNSCSLDFFTRQTRGEESIGVLASTEASCELVGEGWGCAIPSAAACSAVPGLPWHRGVCKPPPTLLNQRLPWRDPLPTPQLGASLRNLLFLFY